MLFFSHRHGQICLKLQRESYLWRHQFNQCKWQMFPSFIASERFSKSSEVQPSSSSSSSPFCKITPAAIQVWTTAVQLTLRTFFFGYLGKSLQNTVNLITLCSDPHVLHVNSQKMERILWIFFAKISSLLVANDGDSFSFSRNTLPASAAGATRFPAFPARHVIDHVEVKKRNGRELVNELRNCLP